MSNYVLSVTTDTARHHVRGPSLVSRRLQRFSLKHRDAVTALAARDPRLADLAVSFPALLFALAVPRAGVNTDRVIELMRAGARLSELACAAGLAMWTRRLPPEAFVCALPPLSDGELFGRQIVNHLPRSPKQAARWLDAVAMVGLWGTPEAAIWIAREFNRNSAKFNDRRYHGFALYAWFSGEPQTIAGSLIKHPWHLSMGYDAVRRHSRDWIENVRVYAVLGSALLTDIWLNPGEIDGFEFVPLKSASDIIEEADAMGHCLRRYATGVAINRCRVWGVRREAERIATLEIGRLYPQPLLCVKQLRGKGNAIVDAEVWNAALKWLHSHNLMAVRPVAIADSRSVFCRAAWMQLWTPYWKAKQRLPDWLPLSPTHCAINGL